MTDLDLGIDELSDFRTIGSGGFSTVYAAWDEGFSRSVAVKVLHSLDEAGRRRFERERAIMGRLSSHQNVITPFRAGYTILGAPYFVMELVEGGSLEDQLINRGAIPWAEALDYMIPATAALAHAHAHDVLHRDVKPGNILLGTVPKLTDFGIAAIRESTASQVAYTLSHCAPETFASGRDARDERSDLYSAASTVQTLITGQAPFAVDGEDSQQAYMFRIIDQAPAEIPPETAPPALREVLTRTLAKDPAQRPQSAQEFGELLHRIRAAHDTSASGYRPAFATSETQSTTSPQIPTSPTWPPPTAHTEVRPENTNRAAPTQAAPSPAAHPFDASTSGPRPPRRRVPGIVAALGALALVALLAAGAWWLFLRSDPEGPPPVAWTFETESSLASKPAVADGTLVIGAHVTNTVHALDTETGAERWSFDAGSFVDAGPAIHDGVVYIGSDAGTMFALDLDNGSVVWESELGDAIVAEALVDDDLVIVGTDEGSVSALARATGDEEWTTEIGPRLNSKPALAVRNGEPVVAIGSTDGALYLLDPATGQELGRIGLEGGVWFSDPLPLDQTDGDSQEIWVGTSAADRGFLNRIDLDDLTVQTFQTSAGVGTNPVVAGDNVIVAGNDLGELFGVDRTTLGEVWRQGYANDNQIKGSPVVVGDTIIFGTHDKELIAVEAGDGTELWRFEAEQIFGLSAPIVVDGALYVGNDAGTVYRFDL